MGLRFRILGSGSSGNATLVEAGKTRILLDAGLGPRELVERLLSAEIDPTSLATIFLSHEHSDHFRGAVSFSRKWGVRLCGTTGTYAATGLGACQIAGYDLLVPGIPYEVGALTITGIPIPHDAAQPVAFLVSYEGSSLGHATDLGHINETMVTAFQGCHAILMESNYDSDMLRDGPYPWSLKERILGPRGHLSNEIVGRYLAQDLGRSCRTVVLAHLSQKNNHPEVARMVAELSLKKNRDTHVQLEISGREGTGWIEVGPRPILARRVEQLRLW